MMKPSLTTSNSFFFEYFYVNLICSFFLARVLDVYHLYTRQEKLSGTHIGRTKEERPENDRLKPIGNPYQGFLFKRVLFSSKAISWLYIVLSLYI